MKHFLCRLRSSEATKPIVVRKRLLRQFGQATCLALKMSLAVGLFALVEGCDSHESAENAVRGRNLQKVDDSANATSYEGESENTLLLEHDFGILKPEQQVEHAFVVENKTDARWTVRKIINMCACTVSDLSAPVIEPGGKEEVLVAYRAGGGSHDDRRKVVVLFEEVEAPRVFLEIRAKIRESMTLDPPRVAFLEIGRGQSQSSNFEVHNFDDCDWQGISVEPKVDWLRTAQTEISFEPSPDLPRQIWRIGVMADATGLSCGDHDGEILVQAQGVEEKAVKSVPVRVRVTSPVHAIPGQFFFGQIKAGQPAMQTIKIRFTSDAVPSSPGEIVFEHDLGEQLRLEWLATSGTQWELRATLTASRGTDLSSQEVVVGFSNPRLPKLELPIYAVIEAEKPGA